MRKLDRKSILVKIALIMLAVVLTHSGVLFASIFGTDFLTSFKKNALDLFETTTEGRKNYLENEMLTRWSNIEEYRVEVEMLYDQYADGNTILTVEETEDFLRDSTTILKNILGRAETSGAFLILDDAETATSSHSALYYTRSESGAITVDYNDLQMSVGPSEIASEYNISLANDWTYGAQSDFDDRELFHNALAVGNLDMDRKYMGYWSAYATAVDKNETELLFTLPLISDNGVAFGLIGVVIDVNLLYKFLPFEELADTGSYGYILVRKDVTTEKLIPIYTYGTVQNNLVQQGNPLELMQADDSDAMYIESIMGDVVIHMELLELYDPNTPFIQHELYLMGMASMENITGAPDALSESLIQLMVGSVIVSVIFAYIIGYYFSKPIKNLSREVSRGISGESIHLKRIGITEIDELSASIEQLTQDVIETTTRTDKILDLVHIKVGTFEYNNQKDDVKISKSLGGMLAELLGEWNGSTIDHNKFEKIITDIKSRPEEGIKQTYRYTDQTEKWYKITESQKGNTLSGIMIDHTKEVLEHKAITYQRDYDMLTGVNSRLAFYRKALQLFQDDDLGISIVAVIDLDNLKYVNDTFGHDVGDNYIIKAARVMQRIFIHNSIVGRMAGDEFLLLLHHFESKDAILANIADFYAQLETEPVLLPDGTELKVRASAGLAWYQEDSCNLAELVTYADFAMYTCKRSEKGEIRTFDEIKYREQSFLFRGKEELNLILEKQKVDFAFQPIISAVTGELYAYESLIRPQSEILDTPFKLLQIATVQSQLAKVERVTFFKSLELYREKQEKFQGAKLFINSVPNQCLKDAEYEELEQKYGDILSNVVVEIIETEQFDMGILQEKLARVLSWNGQVALDDYGAGYSNDLNLLALQPNVVKIDRSIILSVETDVSRQDIVANTIGFCRARGVKVLAEGIETQSQLEYLVHAGVDLLQGYYIGRPALDPSYRVELQAEIAKIKEQSAIVK